MDTSLRIHARAIWKAAVDAVKPDLLLPKVLRDPELLGALQLAKRILVLGGGKAGAAMALAVEESLPELLPKITGFVNVPADTVRPLQKIQLHAGRPAGVNQPTAEGVSGTLEILKLAESAGPNDVALCLISGGGSALLPAPADGISLADKQAITKVLHACGATINEMNAVRKHLSAFKGGRLAQAFRGQSIYSLIISDVIGDPLDVIASGPTAADPSTFEDSLAILDKFDLRSKTPRPILNRLEKGLAGAIPETLKEIPNNVHNWVIGNNVKALEAAQAAAERLGYPVLNLGSYLEGDTAALAGTMASLARSICEQGVPQAAPLCVLSGGETTVNLGQATGKGGRNQEFVLAFLEKVGALPGVVVLSGGTDGEDGPTDAAGAIGDARTLSAGLSIRDYLSRHDAYRFFEATGDLLKCGLTQTNVMDVRVILIGRRG